MDLTNEALKIWNALKPMIDKEIKTQTKSCVRCKKMKVITAPNGFTVGVAEPYGEVINVPYSTSISNVEVGDSVWVWWFYGNAATMIALAYGNGQIVDPYAIVNDLPQFHVDTATGELHFEYPSSIYAENSFAIDNNGNLVINDGGNYPEEDYSINDAQNVILSY